MSRIIFNLAAKTDAAGRPRTPNQDNCWVCPDLSKWDAPTINVVGTDEDVVLSDKGALLIVADGMGGMNAGEVASRLVIEGVQKKFSSIPDTVLDSDVTVKNFIRDAIIEADEGIKSYAKAHREAEGLGSTIVLVWLLNGKAYCGWCGDSRIYRYNPNNELVRLSHDHSYVQSLVDEGKISEEEAFDHPDGNIISKALGDNGEKADPELCVYDVYQRDVFMLCSDGLCGLLQDKEINEIISSNCTSSKDALEKLWEEGTKAGWNDNATIDVLCVVDGGKPAKGRPDGYRTLTKKSQPSKAANPNDKAVVIESESWLTKLMKPPLLYSLAALALLLIGYSIYSFMGRKDKNGNSNQEFHVEQVNGAESTAPEMINGGEDGAPTQSQSANMPSRGSLDNANANSSRPQQPNNGRSAQNNNVDNSHNQNNEAGNQNPQTSSNVAQPDQGSAPETQAAEPAISRQYMQMFSSVDRDYRKAFSAFNYAKKNGRNTRTDEVIGHYLNNIQDNIRSLRNDKDYNALNASQKGKITQFETLANRIKNEYFSIPGEL